MKSRIVHGKLRKTPQIIHTLAGKQTNNKTLTMYVFISGLLHIDLVSLSCRQAVKWTTTIGLEKVGLA